jgi:anti-anti-sigma factor
MVAFRHLTPSTDDLEPTGIMPLTLSHRHLAGISVIAVGGEVDIANADVLARYVADVRRPGDHVVFDLTELAFLDCSGLRVLLRGARQAAAQDAVVRIAGAHGTPARLLQVLQVHVLLPVYDTVTSALAAIPAGACARTPGTTRRGPGTVTTITPAAAPGTSPAAPMPAPMPAPKAAPKAGPCGERGPASPTPIRSSSPTRRRS